MRQGGRERRRGVKEAERVEEREGRVRVNWEGKEGKVYCKGICRIFFFFLRLYSLFLYSMFCKILLCR